ncbi:MAG: DUF234 domain-containing protein, partial [Candidatus Micrarchaeia archaeon]
KPENVVDLVMADYDNYIGKYVFEGVCRAAFRELAGFKYSKIGRWWLAGEEIDLVAINENNNEICFAECKWRNRKASVSELRALEEKAKKVSWRNGSRKERFAFFSRSGFNADAEDFAEKNRILLFDLNDIEKALGQKQGGK